MQDTITKVKITNGFPNTLGKGILLTGVLIEGNVYLGDRLVADNGIEVPIIDVEFDKKTFPGITHIVLTIPHDNNIVWHKLYGKTFEIKNTAYNII